MTRPVVDLFEGARHVQWRTGRNLVVPKQGLEKPRVKEIAIVP